MQHARPLLLVVTVAFARAPSVHAQMPPTSPQASALTSAVDLTRERTLINESEVARKASDYATARAKAAEAVASLMARPQADHDAAWLALLASGGQSAYSSRDTLTANAAWQRVLEVRLASLPDDHPDVQTVRGNLAVTIEALGDYAGARALEEKVLEVRSRTLPDDHPDLQMARQNLAATIRAMGDFAGARALQEKVLEVRSRTLSDDDPGLQKARQSLAITIAGQGDFAGARALFEKVFEVRSRTLADDHPDLQAARQNVAMTMHSLGDLTGARVLEEKVLEVCSRTLPDDDPDLQVARQNLASTLGDLGDLAGARALFESVLEVRSRTLSDDHPDMLTARGNVAVSMRRSGDLAGARAMEEKVLEIETRILPDDHPDLQVARGNLAVTIRELGDNAGARALLEKVLDVQQRTLLDDHPDLEWTREALAATLCLLGDLSSARVLEEKVIDVLEHTMPDDCLQLQVARGNLAATLSSLGDLAGARALQTKVLDIRSRMLPDEHPDLQVARGNLASTLYLLGDLRGARALEEKVLEVQSRTLPDDHPDLQAARQNLATTSLDLGDLADARALMEKVLEVQSRTLPDDHMDLQRAREDLAIIRMTLGDLAGARTLLEKAYEVLSRTLPDGHPELQKARGNLALIIRAFGDLAGAQALQEKALEVSSHTLPDEHHDVQAARQNLAETIARRVGRAEQSSGREVQRDRCADLIGALCRAQVRAARDVILESPGREAEERCSMLATKLDVSLSYAGGYGVFEPLPVLELESFVLAETTRGAAVVSAELTRKAASAPRYRELRDALGAASDELAGLAQRGTTNEEFDRARAKRESVERELVALARQISGGKQGGVELDVDSLAASLEEREAAVGLRRFRKWRVEAVDELDSMGQPANRLASVDSLCAFVVRSSKPIAASGATSPLELVDLGPIGPIEEAVRAWRDGLGIGSDGRGIAVGEGKGSMQDARGRGIALRERVFDPLLPALAGMQHIVVALDDVMHLVPLDALPSDEDSLLGDHWQIETRTTLTELLHAPAALKDLDQLVAFGDVEYDAGTTASQYGPANPLAAADAKPRAVEDAGILRGSVWSGGFSRLPGTGVEVRGIARCYADRFGADARAELCEHAAATRERLLALAPQARWLHIATHGWFAPESIGSWGDPEPLDRKSGLGMRLNGEEQVRGMSPMLLCGLALAGANLPETATGRVPGLLTADELSTLDLTGCELVVLSACDTNVGERRAGQGVASLQKALQMAGSRSVITSLWKVPDEATKELMLDFYRRLWVEGKPKWKALWEAKTKLREAKDESGQPLYTTRDWAAWVLTGDPL